MEFYKRLNDLAKFGLGKIPLSEDSTKDEILNPLNIAFEELVKYTDTYFEKAIQEDEDTTVYTENFNLRPALGSNNATANSCSKVVKLDSSSMTDVTDESVTVSTV